MTESSEWHDYDCGVGLSYPHSVSAHKRPADRSNLSHQNGLAGVTTPDLAETQRQPGIHPRRGASWEVPPPRTELIWAAIDLDGTLAHGVWTPESNGRDIGKPIDRNVRKLEELRSGGYKIVIHTARGWEHHQAIESWLDFHCIPYDRIVCGKLLAAVYIDDRALESEMYSWLPATQKARQHANWDLYANHRGGD